MGWLVHQSSSIGVVAGWRQAIQLDRRPALNRTHRLKVAIKRHLSRGPWWLAALAALMVVSGVLASVWWTIQLTLTPREFEGVVVSKNTYLEELGEGRTHNQRYILIADQSGRELRVTVDEDIYRRAVAGMVLRRAAGSAEIELLLPSPN